MIQYYLLAFRKDRNMTMNIKKSVAVMLCAVLALAVMSGCMSGTTVKEKDAGEVTIFVDETIKGAITDAAKAYTKPVREKPEREKAIILIVSDNTESIVSRIEKGEYADAVFVLGGETLNALDAAAEGKDFIVHSSRTALNSTDGAQYAIAVLNNSDRQSVVQGFIDYLMSDEAADVLGENGLGK